MLKGVVGIDDESSYGRTQVVIRADGRELWRSGVLTADGPGRPIDLNVSGVTWLGIVVARRQFRLFGT